MHALVIVAVLTSAAASEAGRAAEPPPETAVRTQPASVAADPSVRPSVAPYLLGSGAAALGGAAGVLLSLPLAVPILYLAALVPLPAAVGLLPMLLVVPFAAALGSGGVALVFSDGVGAALVGTLSAAATGVALLAVGAVVASAEPSTSLDLHFGVLSLLAVPSLAAAVSAAAALPFFVREHGAE